jgi:hypothetical protein
LSEASEQGGAAFEGGEDRDEGTDMDTFDHFWSGGATGGSGAVRSTVTIPRPQSTDSTLLTLDMMMTELESQKILLGYIHD